MAPFKSKSQRAWAGEQVKKGKWTQSQFDEWNSVTPPDIPEKVGWPEMKQGLKVKTIRAIRVPKR